MKKQIIFFVISLSISTVLSCCSFPFASKGTKNSSEEINVKNDNITINGNFEVECDKNIIPENEKILYAAGYYKEKDFTFSLLSRNGIENITGVPFIDVSVHRNSFYDQNKICGFYLNNQDEGIIYLYDINTKTYKEVLKDFNYTPKKRFNDVSYFKDNIIIAYGEYDNGFTVFDLNTNTTKNVTVKINRKDISISHAQISGQGYFVSFGYDINDQTIIEELFIDEKGNVLKKYKIANIIPTGSNYMELSPDSTKLLYSIGKTGDNRYIYDFATETVHVLYERNCLIPHWSNDGKSYYLFDYKGKNENREKWVVTKKDVTDYK